MLFLALLSGLLNLASQAVFMRVASAANGDYYLTYYLTTLSFIVFSSLGNLAAHRLRRWLPFVEVSSGLYALAIGAGVRFGALAHLALPTWAAVLMLAPPALALGAHIPLYAHFVRRQVGLTYGIYHLGAAAGVLALEWFVLPYQALSSVLLFLGFGQTILGLLVAAALRRTTATVPEPATKWAGWFRANRGPVTSVFIASFASYMCIAWGLKGYQYMVLPARMHNGIYNGAVLFMIALGGLVSLHKRATLATLAPLVGAGMAAGLYFYRTLLTWLVGAGAMKLEFCALTLALLFSVTALVSAVLFSRIADQMEEERDIAVSRLMVVSALGNLAGGASAIACGSWLLAPWPAFCSELVLVLVLVYVTPKLNAGRRVGWLLAACGGFVIAAHMGYQPIQQSFAMKERSHMKYQASTMQTVLGSTAGFIDSRPANIPDNVLNVPRAAAYFVDGHISHFITAEYETAVAMYSAKFIAKPYGRSMVIGIGSGQSVLGASLISSHTDAVEISPAVLRALPTLGRFNQDVWQRADVTIHRNDGLNFVRHCAHGSYDFIFNTSTYAMMFNAYKLYTDEFVSAAKQCLTHDGVLQLYIDESEGSSTEDVRTFLAPVARHFRHLYIAPAPYPIIFASDRELAPLSDVDLRRTVPRPADQEFLARDAKVLHALSCSGWAPAGPFNPTGTEPISTLDRPVIETNSVRLRLSLFTQGHEGKHSDLFDLLKPFNPELSVPDCGFATRDDSTGNPLLVHQYMPHPLAAQVKP